MQIDTESGDSYAVVIRNAKYFLAHMQREKQNGEVS